jgi:hypothetical protein
MEFTLAVRRQVTDRLVARYQKATRVESRRSWTSWPIGTAGTVIMPVNALRLAAARPRPERAPRTPILRYGPGGDSGVTGVLAGVGWACWEAARAGASSAGLVAASTRRARHRRRAGPVAGRHVSGHNRSAAGRRPRLAAAERPLSYRAGIFAEVSDSDADLGRLGSGPARLR